VNFVQKVTEICRGKAYFTMPFNLWAVFAWCPFGRRA